MTSNKELTAFQDIFWALSHEHRRHILICLSQKQMLGGEIAEQLPCVWSTTTGHLKVLEQAGLVTVEKRGREVVYQINKAGLRVVIPWLSKLSKK